MLRIVPDCQRVVHSIHNQRAGLYSPTAQSQKTKNTHIRKLTFKILNGSKIHRVCHVEQFFSHHWNSWFSFLINPLSYHLTSHILNNFNADHKDFFFENIDKLV
jgi:hypothetical protein